MHVYMESSIKRVFCAASQFLSEFEMIFAVEAECFADSEQQKCVQNGEW